MDLARRNGQEELVQILLRYDQNVTDKASASASTSEDDSSGNSSRERRERKERVSRKMRVSDFEVMRVLGEGCAGKMLLVRHKSRSDLYALKAITKRHVLMHQQLQHTLTEQAVLRRMAAEGANPFVVKLWWSFHDKENLFLVMVRITCKRMPCFQVFGANIMVIGLPPWWRSCHAASTVGSPWA
jgi:serine/threonine protein kinase